MDLKTELSTEIFRLYWSLGINEITFSFQRMEEWKLNTSYSISDFKLCDFCLGALKNKVFLFCTTNEMDTL